MIEYIKVLILALISGATVALPTSSAAHYTLLNSILDFSENEKVLGFYFSVMSLVFSVIIFIFLRKIYATGFKSLFSKGKKNKNYKNLMKNLLLSLIPTGLLFIPVSEGKLVVDYFDSFLVESNLLLVSFASIIGALILVISIWYTRQKYSETLRSADTKSAIRMSVYQLFSYVIPGISHISSGATNMLICDVEPKVVVREIYIYIAPQIFLVNLIKVIRFLLSDIVINPIMLAIAVVSSAVMCSIVVFMMSKINIRRLFSFFSVYSAVFGATSIILSFILH